MSVQMTIKVRFSLYSHYWNSRGTERLKPLSQEAKRPRLYICDFMLHPVHVILEQFQVTAIFPANQIEEVCVSYHVG